MTVFNARATKDGGFDLGSDYNRDKLKSFLKENPGMRLEIKPLTPESNKQRAFYHGAIIPLWAYLDGKDYKNNLTLEQLHEIAKREFNGEIIIVHGKDQKVGKSTKGLLNSGYIERIMDYLAESYGIDIGLLLNPEMYKKFRDEIQPFTNKYDTYIDYMKDIKILN